MWRSAVLLCSPREPNGQGERRALTYRKSERKRRRIMKRGILGTLVLSSCLVTTGRAQVGGSGTPNTIPQFTTGTTIGDSPIIESNGNIGIGSTNPNSRLEVFDFRQSGGNANGAVFGLVNCTAGNTQPTCAGVRGDASSATVGAVGILGNNFASDAGGGSGVLGQAFGTNASGVRGLSTVTSGTGIGVQGEALSEAGAAGWFINRAFGTILGGAVGPSGAVVFRVDGTGRGFANSGFRPFGADF